MRFFTGNGRRAKAHLDRAAHKSGAENPADLLVRFLDGRAPSRNVEEASSDHYFLQKPALRSLPCAADIKPAPRRQSMGLQDLSAVRWSKKFLGNLQSALHCLAKPVDGFSQSDTARVRGRLQRGSGAAAPLVAEAVSSGKLRLLYACMCDRHPS